MEITIQRAKPHYAEELTVIAKQAKSYWGYSDELLDLWKIDLSITPEYVQQNHVYCAESKDAGIIGLYSLSGQKVMEIDHLWVRPSYLRMGIGQQLFRHAVDIAQTQNAERIQILSDPNAEQFYLKMGARKIGLMDARPEGRKLPLLVYSL